MYLALVGDLVPVADNKLLLPHTAWAIDYAISRRFTGVQDVVNTAGVQRHLNVEVLPCVASQCVIVFVLIIGRDGEQLSQLLLLLEVVV